MTVLTEQYYFTETVKYLQQQTERCVNEHGRCVYLMPNGNKCGIGYWIPDRHEAQESSGGLTHIVSDFPDLVGVIVPDTENGHELGRVLQVLHDIVTYANRQGFAFENKVKSIAAEYKLSLDGIVFVN